MSHNRARARRLRQLGVPVDLSAELPVCAALEREMPLPDPASWEVPDFAPWDKLLQRDAVGDAGQRLPVVDEPTPPWGVAALRAHIEESTQQVPALARRPGLLGLTVQPVPQDTARWFR